MIVDLETVAAPFRSGDHKPKVRLRKISEIWRHDIEQSVATV
jgi:hypothetical protein